MSKQRSLRKSRATFDDGDEEEEETGVSVAAPPASAAAAWQLRQKEKTLLSFDEDAGDAGGAKWKGGKARASLRAPVPAGGLLDSGGPGATYTQVAGAGEYTADKLKELQRATLRPPGSKQAGGGGGAFKLSGSFKAVVPPKDDRFSHKVAAAGVLEPGAMPLPPPPLPPSAAIARSGPSLAAAHPLAVVEDRQGAAEYEDEEEGDIPDEQMIKWAKAKRDRLRSAHLAPDYIPTAAWPGRGRMQPGRPASAGGEGALRGLEEEAGPAGSGSDGEAEPEDAMRMQFVGKPGGGKSVLAAAGELQEGGEDEEEAWAEEQIRKGMGGGALPTAAAKAKPPKPAVADELGFGAGRAPAAGPAATGASQAAAIAAAADEVVASLQAALQRVQMSQRQAEKNLARTRHHLESSAAGIARAEADLRLAGDKYTYVQRLRAYLADLCAMLEAKSALAEELEEELSRLRAERARVHADRCADDDREAFEPAQAAVSAALAALSHGSSIEDTAAAAAAGAAEAERQLLSGAHLPEELDEFGRDVNAQRKGQAAARAERRAQRLAALGAQFQRPHPGSASAAAWREPALGDATTEESDGEVSHFNSRVEEIRDAGGAVFKDVAEEYSSVDAIKSALEEWKARYPGQYHDAYVSLSAPALFAPFVRLELLRWAPLDLRPGSRIDGGEEAAAGGGFEQQEWYRLLFDYGMHAEHADPNDPDANLVPRLVRSLVLPLAERLLQEVWNPWSARQSVAAAAMLKDLLIYVPPQDEGLQRVMRLVRGRLEAAVVAAALPAWPPVALAASRRAEVHLAHRFGKALRLLRSVAAFRAALPLPEVQQLAVGRLLRGTLLPYVRSAAADPAALAARADRVVAALPEEWLRGAVPPRGAEGLLELLVAVARPLEAKAADPGARVAGAPVAKQLAGVLAKLGDGATAKRLAMMYAL